MSNSVDTAVEMLSLLNGRILGSGCVRNGRFRRGRMGQVQKNHIHRVKRSIFSKNQRQIMEPMGAGRGIDNRDVVVEKETIVKRLILYGLICLALGMAACTGGGSETAVAQTDETIATLTPTAYPTPYPEMPKPDSCPTTQRPEPRFIPPEPYPEWAPGGGFWYGTNELWLDLRSAGTWHGLPKSDAGYVNKIALWSESYSQTLEQQPEITLSARQLDGEAMVEPHVHGTNAHHPDYGHFMMTGIELPSLGCWEITAEYRDASLGFVVWVTP